MTKVAERNHLRRTAVLLALIAGLSFGLCTVAAMLPAGDDGGVDPSVAAHPDSCHGPALSRESVHFSAAEFASPSAPAPPAAPPVASEQQRVPATLVKPRLVPIPGDTFLMGTDSPPPATRADGEHPARFVTVSAFELDAYEVSIGAFAAFVSATAYQTEAERLGWSFVFTPMVSAQTRATHLLGGTSVGVVGGVSPWWSAVRGASWRAPTGPDSDVFPDTPLSRAPSAATLAHTDPARLNEPVTHVSHADAVAYCAWRGPRMRLPTEAEWEMAARGGHDQAPFPWGNHVRSYPEDDDNREGKPAPPPAEGEQRPPRRRRRTRHRANIWHGVFPTSNTADDGYSGPAPVSAFGPQNAFGVYNMMGNVWEWVSDRWGVGHSTIPSDVARRLPPAVDPTGPDTGRSRVKRGGSFLCHESYCFRYRCSARSQNTPDTSANNLGFRCARSLDAPPAREL